MKKIKQIQALVSPVLIFAMVLFTTSCGHSPSKEGDLFSNMDKEASASTEEGSAPDMLGAEDVVASNDKPLTGTNGKLTDTAAVDPTMLGGESTTAGSPTSGAAFDTEAPASDTVASLEKADAQAPISVPSNIAGSETIAQATEVKEGEQAPAEATVAKSEETVSADLEKAIDEAAAPQPRVAKAPAIPTESVWRKGHALNRYYFLRSGDTPMSVAEAIYGNSAKANDLIEWNGGTWAAGKMVLFVSEQQPDDAAMKSIYEERDMKPEQYTVKAGDWLSKIAETAYGSSNSWKEIAAMNNLQSPDSISVGATIALYPTKVPAPVKDVPRVAAAEKEASAPAPVVVAKPEAPAPKEVVVAKKDVDTQKDVDGVEMASPEGMTNFIEQHLVGIIAALLLAVGVYFFIGRMRRSKEYLE